MYKTISWNTGRAAERARSKSEPAPNKKLIKKYHDAWCRANGYKLQASSRKPQAASTLKKTQS